MNEDILSLLEDKTRSSYQRVASGVIDGTWSPAELMDIFCTDNSQYKRYRQLVSWPLALLSEQSPEHLYPIVPLMIELISIDREDDSYARNILRFWQNMDMPSEYESEVYDLAFAYLSDPRQATAIKVFAMTTCTRMAERYPELAHEIIPVIEEYMPHGTAGYINRGNKMLKRLYELVDNKM